MANEDGFSFHEEYSQSQEKQKLMCKIRVISQMELRACRADINN